MSTWDKAEAGREVGMKAEGTGRVVDVDYQSPDVRRQMFNATTSTNYDAFNRFGRTVRQAWDKYNTGAAALDQIHYGLNGGTT